MILLCLLQTKRSSQQAVILSHRWYFEGKNNKEKFKQQMQWAGTGDGQPGSHQRFTLLGKKVCSGAICKLVGFSPQTWTRTHRKRSAEIHVDRLHGNTVCIVSFLAPYVNRLCTNCMFHVTAFLSTGCSQCELWFSCCRESAVSRLMARWPS